MATTTMTMPPQRCWLALAVMLCVFATGQADHGPAWNQGPYMCAYEGEHCLCVGDVTYGQKTRRSWNFWVEPEEHWTDPRPFNGGIACINQVFGDPFPGVRKQCECHPTNDGPHNTGSPSHNINCMSGNTGTFKATLIGNSTGFNTTVTIVKELAVGDTIEGLDADKKPALCTVEAIGQFGHGELFGNYTDDHFVLNPATGDIKQHGAVGNRTEEDRYDVMTSCPVGLDEAGTGFTPMDGGFCGKSTAEMAWSDYLLIHASMLRIVRATGGYWFSASAYSDFDSVVQHGPELCAAMLACAGEGSECDELERVAELFIDHYLTDTARNASHAGMPGLGQVGAPGSASFVVSQGKADMAVSTEYIALSIGAAVLVAVVLVAVVVAAVRRRARSTPAITEVKDTVRTPDPVAPLGAPSLRQRSGLTVV